MKRVPKKRVTRAAAPDPALAPLAHWLPRGPVWLNGLLLAAWTAYFIYAFERVALRDAANLDGGIIFALATFTFGYLLTAAGLFSRSLSGISPVAMALSGLVPLLFLQGARTSAGEIFTMQSMPWYVGANLLWALLGASAGKPGWDEQRSNRRTLLLLALVPLVLGGLILWLRTYTFAHLSVPADRNSLHHLFVPRASSSNDIVGKDFDRWMSLVWPLAFGAALGAVLAMRDRIKALPERRLLLGLLGLSILGKLCIAALSSQGLDIIGEKIISVNTNYYKLVSLVEERGVWGYVRDYGSLQLDQKAHGDTHPPGPVLLYWLLTRFLGKNPALVGMAIGFLSSLAVPLIYSVARRHYGSKEAGLAAALLYLSSPLSLILSSAGIDPIVSTVLMLGIYALSRAHEERPWVWGIWSGLSFFAASFFSFGAPITLMVTGLWSLDTLLRRRGTQGLVTLLWIWLPLLLTFVACHGLLWAIFAGKFSYFKAVNDAQFIHRSMNQYRTYELWSWSNVLLFAGYTGLGLLAVSVIRSFSSLWRADGSDGLLNASTPFVLTLIFACMGRSEVQREFLFGALFLALPAAAFFLKPANKGGDSLRSGVLGLALGWNLITAVMLEILVLDYW